MTHALGPSKHHSGERNQGSFKGIRNRPIASHLEHLKNIRRLKSVLNILCEISATVGVFFATEDGQKHRKARDNKEDLKAVSAPLHAAESGVCWEIMSPFNKKMGEVHVLL